MDAQSHVGTSVLRLHCWLSAAGLLIVLVVTQQRVNTRLTVMIITSVLELEKLKSLQKSCATAQSMNKLLGTQL